MIPSISMGELAKFERNPWRPRKWRIAGTSALATGQLYTRGVTVNSAPGHHLAGQNVTAFGFKLADADDPEERPGPFVGVLQEVENPYTKEFAYFVDGSQVDPATASAAGGLSTPQG